MNFIKYSLIALSLVHFVQAPETASEKRARQARQAQRQAQIRARQREAQAANQASLGY